jgi:hypothetical protein
MKRRLRTLGVVLRDAERLLAALALCPHAGFARQIAAKIAQYQLQRAPPLALARLPLRRQLTHRVAGDHAIFFTGQHLHPAKKNIRVDLAVIDERESCLGYCRDYTYPLFFQAARPGKPPSLDFCRVPGASHALVMSWMMESQMRFHGPPKKFMPSKNARGYQAPSRTIAANG